MAGRQSVTIIGGKKNLFGPQIEALRRSKGLTQAQVIAQLGLNVPRWDLSEDTYAHIEKGRRMLTDSELVAILHVFGVGLEVLKMPTRKKVQRLRSK
ncbi:MAG: helix-turn-helix transcriptional regulator [Verrucomicrobia bacterium]|nr:helix-turn-helix transcriptional regulator [Verrucomicrobiota bacterium]